MIGQEELRRILDYDAGSGVFKWREKVSIKTVVGRWAGCLNKAGYIVIGIRGKTYYAHRLALIYMTGSAPAQIDHADGDRSNNRFANLRAATHQQNVLNAKRAANNSSGFKGVRWHKATGKWESYICTGGKKTHLGLYETPESAHAAYFAAARGVQPDFARAA